MKSDNRKQARHLFSPRNILFGAVALSIGAIALWYFMPRPTLDELAERYAREVFDGNPEYALQFVPDYELRRMGMSRDQARLFIQNVIAPKLSKVRFVRPLERHQQHGILGTSYFELRNEDGFTFPMGVDVELSDSGPIRLLKVLLKDAWYLEYFDSQNAAPTVLLRTKAVLWGLEKDIDTLLSYGFSGFASEVDESRPAEPVHAALERLRKRVNDPHAGQESVIYMPSSGNRGQR